MFIWIFEEVYESSITLTVDQQGTIESTLCEQGVLDLYDYSAQDIIGKKLDFLVPSLEMQCSTWQDRINKLRFFASQTKRGAQFPIIVRLLDEFTVQITSMPVIAGLMTIQSDGIIEGCNDIFVKYLFGFSQQDLVLKKNISQLLPQFPTLLKNLKRDDLLQQGLIINNTICRKLLPQQSMVNKQRLLTHTPNNQPLPILVALHRDGTPFEVQLQLKLVESSKQGEQQQQDEYALWISFDREIAFKRFGHHHLISQAPPEKQEKIAYSPTRTVLVIPPPPQTETKRSPSVISTSHDDTLLPEQQDADDKRAPPPQDIVYSAQTKSTSIDDYVILDSLGQGAYGLVKLAVKRNDPSQVNCRIWFICIE